MEAKGEVIGNPNVNYGRDVVRIKLEDTNTIISSIVITGESQPYIGDIVTVELDPNDSSKSWVKYIHRKPG